MRTGRRDVSSAYSRKEAVTGSLPFIWDGEEEPFVDQWKCIQETLKDPKYREGTIWLMGDFNSQDDVRTSNVICNGKNAPVVSDHYGVMITV